jgi:hypothetical protein
MVQAQETNDVEQLRNQLREMQENFRKIQQQQQQQIEELSRKLESLSKNPATTNPAAVAQSPEQSDLEKQLAAELAANADTNAPPKNPSAEIQKNSWSPSQPMTIARAGSAYMNVSFDSILDAGWSTAHDPSEFLQLGDHDPLKRGFTVPNAEIALDGAVDPYFRGFANIVLKLDKDNETAIELEEAFLESTSLPANLQLKAGQFFANFGRQNPQHPHQWAFVDQPLILNRAMGPEGLRNPGAQLSWLTPLPFYTEIFLGILDGRGEIAHNFRNAGESDDLGINRVHGRVTLDRELRRAQDLLFTPRIASSFELSENQTVLAGISGAFGPNNTSSSARTEIYGADIYWKWKPANAAQNFPFVSWQTEALYGRFGAGADAGAGLPSENLVDYGFYSQILWGFKPRWVTGLRGEYVNSNDGAFDALDVFRGERWRVSPVLTFYPSEFSKVRLQYNYDQGEHFGGEHSVWMQLEFLLGAHGAHKF